MYLAIYDISGIQRYIFSTGKLREQVGASRIVHNILYHDLPTVLGEEPYRWEEKRLLNFEGKKHHIVYIGGGNAVVLYEDKKYMEDRTRLLQKKVIEMTENKLRLCYAGIDIGTGADKNYGKVYSDLMKEMSSSKNLPSPIQLVSGFAIGEHDSITKESLVLMPSAAKDSKVLEKYGPISRVQKERVFRQPDNEQEQDKKAYSVDFESFRKKDRKSFVAVIHIDGDTMGQQIQAAVEKFSEVKNFEESMLEIRTLSKEIDSLYKAALDSAIKDLYGSSQSEKIPFRPLITDGDDITLVMEAERAFDFVESFMENLIKCRSNFQKMREYDFKVSASAGIVFVHDKFPFYAAYEIAEQLCKSAKSVKKNDEQKKHISTMDFHIIHSGMRSNLEEYRKENYLKKRGKDVFELQLRPYFFEDGEGSNLYKSFRELRKTVKNRTKSEMIARSKLKGLRNAYAEGVDAAERYHTFILSRDPGGISGKSEENAFENHRARFFDVLDAMDL